ncbi:MAG: hypothetical protein PSN04_10475 [Methyloprofundus sp.]|nr:hypothetical protein [Methyloprofundus sp.]
MQTNRSASPSEGRNIFIIIAILILVIFLYIKGEGLSNRVHEKITKNHSGLANANNLSKEAVLGIRLGLVLNYDN